MSRFLDIDWLTTIVNGAWFSADALMLYVSAEMPAQDDIYVATRSSIAEPFGELTPLHSLNSPYIDRYPSLSPDGLWLFFTSDRSGSLDLFLAKREALDAPFGEPFPLIALNTPGREDSGSWSADGRHLYYDSVDDMFRVAIDGEGNVGVPELLTELNSDTRDIHPIISADDLSIYWSALVPGTSSRDVFMAVRTTRTETFSSPVHLRPPSSRLADYPTFVSPDDCALFVLQATDAADYDLIVAERQRP